LSSFQRHCGSPEFAPSLGWIGDADKCNFGATSNMRCAVVRLPMNGSMFVLAGEESEMSKPESRDQGARSDERNLAR
jgi:hypothetical protein